MSIGKRVKFASHHIYSGETGRVASITRSAGGIDYICVALDKVPDNKAFSHLTVIGADLCDA